MGSLSVNGLKLNDTSTLFLIIFTFFSFFFFSFAFYTHFINIDLEYRINTLNVNKIN